MKHISLLCIMGCLLLITACSSNEEKTPSGEATLNFYVTNYEMTSLDHVTKAAATTLQHLDMAIYNSQSEELISVTQTTQEDNGYGTFSATLPYGSYTIVFLGYDGSRKADVEQLTSICYADNFVPNFFYKTLELTISSATNNAQTIALERAVAAFMIKSNGDIPTNLNKIRISATGGGHHFNAKTGTAVQVEDRSYTYNVSSYAGKESISVTYFSFLTATEGTMNFNVTALDEADNVIRSRDFNDVPMKINQRTTYSGSFFSKDESVQGFSLTLADDEWEENNNTF